MLHSLGAIGQVLEPSTPRSTITWGRRARAPLFLGGAVLWASLVLLGLKWLADYATVPGEQEPAPATWPRESALSPVAGRSTLLMFVHPKCPCTRASLTELNIIMNEDREHVAAFVVFLRPDGAGSDWAETDTWDYAGTIPHSARVVDRNGVEAKRFGALTSGHVTLYDTDGRLAFSGGITDSRGHAGNNMGRQAILGLLARAPTALHGHAVFGCPMGEGAETERVSPQSTP